MSQRLKDYQPSQAMGVLIRVYSGCNLESGEFEGILRCIIALMAAETDYLYEEAELIGRIVPMLQVARADWMRDPS